MCSAEKKTLWNKWLYILNSVLFIFLSLFAGVLYTFIRKLSDKNHLPFGMNEPEWHFFRCEKRNTTDFVILS